MWAFRAFFSKTLVFYWTSPELLVLRITKLVNCWMSLIRSCCSCYLPVAAAAAELITRYTHTRYSCYVIFSDLCAMPFYIVQVYVLCGAVFYFWDLSVQLR